MKKRISILAIVLVVIACLSFGTLTVNAESNKYTMVEGNKTYVFTLNSTNNTFTCSGVNVLTKETVERQGTYERDAGRSICFYIDRVLYKIAAINEDTHTLDFVLHGNYPNELLDPVVEPETPVQPEQPTEPDVVPDTEQPTEDKLPTTDDIIDNSGLNEEDKEFIKGVVDKVKEYTNNSDNFFVKYIVPLLIAGVLCLLVGIILILPILRKGAENKTLKGMCKNYKAQVDALKAENEKLKTDMDSGKIEKEVKEFIHTEIGNMAVMIQDKLTKSGVEIDKIESVLVSLINGALNAWKASPEAVACLTQNASAQELKNVAERNAKLEAYIYQKYGEKAGEEISKL